MFKFFESSTFIDMQAERDAIQLRLYPKIKNKLEKLGQDIEFRDLRWGINTKDDSTDEERLKRILQVCFKEIKSCHPYFIVLLGERYGSCPDEDDLEKVLEHMNEADSTKSFTVENVKGKSYTALELEFGPFSDEETFRHTLFLFRKPIENAPAHFNPKSEENAQKQKELKERIKNHPWGARIREYSLSVNADGSLSGISEFIELVEAELLEILREKLDEAARLEEWELERNRQISECRRNALAFYSPDMLEKAMDAFDENVHTVAICGKEESGKTCLCSKVTVQKLEEGWNVYPISISEERSVSEEEIYAKWGFYIRSILGKEQPEKKNVRHRYLPYSEFVDLLAEYSAKISTPLLLTLDSIQAINPAENAFQPERILYTNFPNVHTLITVRIEEDVFKNTERDRYVFVNYTEEDKRSILEGQLASIGKSIPNETKKLILELHSDKSPYYLSLLIKRLAIIDGDDLSKKLYEDKNPGERGKRRKGERLYGINQITKLQSNIVENSPKSSPKLAKELIFEICDRLGNGFAMEVLSLIACAPFGISRKELEGVFANIGGEFDNLTLSLLIWNLDIVFTEDEAGVIKFKSERVRIFVTERIERQKYCRILIDYVEGCSRISAHLSKSIIKLCKSCNDVDAFLRVARKDVTFFAGRGSTEQLLRRENLEFITDAYKSATGDDKLTIHRFLKETVYRNRIRGYDSVYKSIFELDAIILEELYAADPKFADELGAAYLALTSGQIDRANEYLEMAESLITVDETNVIEFIGEHLSFAGSYLYYEPEKAIDHIKKAEELIERGRAKITDFRVMIYAYELYELKSKIIHNYEVDGRLHELSLTDNTADLLFEAFEIYVHICERLERVVDMKKEYALLKSFCSRVAYADEKNGEFVTLCQKSIDTFIRILDNSEGSTAYAGGYFAASLIAAFIKRIGNCPPAELSYSGGESGAPLSSLGSELARVLVKIEKAHTLPNAVWYADELITAARYLATHGEYESARSVVASLKSALSLHEARNEKDNHATVTALLFRAKIGYVTALSNNRLGENATAQRGLVEAAESLHLHALRNKCCSYPEAEKVLSLTADMLYLYPDIIDNLESYQYNSGEVMSFLCSTAAIICQDWEAFFDYPTSLNAAIEPTLALFNCLESLSKATEDYSEQIWYLAISSTYTTVFGCRYLTELFGKKSGDTLQSLLDALVTFADYFDTHKEKSNTVISSNVAFAVNDLFCELKRIVKCKEMLTDIEAAYSLIMSRKIFAWEMKRQSITPVFRIRRPR